MTQGSGFSHQFGHYLAPGEDEIKSVMTSGMVVLDTNILLDAYRFAPAGRKELMSVLAKVADRTWIPHQVAEEFHRNRLSVMMDHDGAYRPVIDLLKATQKTLDTEAVPKINHLATRTALPEKEKNRILSLVANATKQAASAVEKLREEHGLGEVRGDDAILAEYQNLYQGRVGGPFEGTEYDEAIKESERRISEEIPPGFRDSKKDNPHGDYLVWSQALREARKRHPSHLLFVTEDTKEDWYLVLKGKVICAQPELAKELAEVAQSKLVMMSLPTFLYHSKNYLDADVSGETIRQSESMSQSEQDERRREKLTARLMAEREHLLVRRLTLEARLAEVKNSASAARSTIETLTELQNEIIFKPQPAPEKMEELREVNQMLDAARRDYNSILMQTGALESERNSVEIGIEEVTRRTHEAMR